MVSFIVKVESLNRQNVKVRGDLLVDKKMEDSPTEEMSAKGSSPSSALIRSFLPFLALLLFKTIKRTAPTEREKQSVLKYITLI